jgi:hypothetical protein
LDLETFHLKTGLCQFFKNHVTRILTGELVMNYAFNDLHDVVVLRIFSPKNWCF